MREAGVFGTCQMRFCVLLSVQDAPAASSALPLSDRVHAAFRLAEKEEEATRALVGESEGGMTSS